tara:strand:+ start:821 stop:1720 length:900 start_codon:yes stop_codon:yes gene_type:complete
VSEIQTIPNIITGGGSIPYVEVNGTGINFVSPVKTNNSNVEKINLSNIPVDRLWIVTPPQSTPITVPVTQIIGSPIVNVPGCVTVHKENARERNKNKQLVNDDPKGNTTLCDAGAPYYYPADYDYRDLTWTTVNPNEENVDEGVNTEDPPAPNLDTPEPPPTPTNTDGEVECPPPNARRIGDLSQNGNERVKEYKLTPDGKICETIWEDVPAMDAYLPAINVVTTTASIAAVATTSALLAKPLADLLLKVVKPLVKKTIAKVKEKVLGKKPPVLSLRERILKQKEANAAVKAARQLKGK